MLLFVLRQGTALRIEFTGENVDTQCGKSSVESTVTNFDTPSSGPLNRLFL